MLIQKLPRPDSIIASELLLVEFCNNIGPDRPVVAPQELDRYLE